MKTLEHHPFAALLPMMSEPDYEALKADVVANGQFNEPATLFQGKLLDGRNRYRVAKETGIKLPTVPFKGNEAAALRFVYSKAVHRNMDMSQKAAAAVGFIERFEAEAKARKLAALKQNTLKAIIAEGAAGRSREQIGGCFGVSGTYIQYAKSLRDGDKALFQQVFEGKLPLTRAVSTYRRAHRTKEANAKRCVIVRKGGMPMCELNQGDAVKRMETYNSGFAKLAFFDPPYNLGFSYDGDPTKDQLPADNYLALITACASELHRILSSDGSLFVLICEEWVCEFGVLLKRQGFTVRRLITWYETFGQNAANNFNRTNRYLFYCVKDPNRFTFNTAAVRTKSKRETDYGDKRANPDGKNMDAVWEISRLCGTFAERLPDKGIPTQLPLEMLKKIIGVASDPGDVVYDPMFGTGTTARAAALLHRRFVGDERSARYVKIAQREQATLLNQTENTEAK